MAFEIDITFEFNTPATKFKKMANNVHKNFNKYGALYHLQQCCNPLCNVKNVYSNNTFNTIDQLWKIPMHSRIFHTDHDYRSKYYEYVSYNSLISCRAYSWQLCSVWKDLKSLFKCSGSTCGSSE